ncbi:hypothetical protein VTO42DRAFT_3271 [Malbranchea cinnamomea]
MTSFLDLRSSPPSRPNTSSLAPSLRGNDDNDYTSRQLPLMSSSSVLPSSPPRHRHHHRSSTHSPKRLSVFGSRSRSNTTTSTTSSYKSPASSMTSASSSHRSSQESRGPASFVVSHEKHESRARSLFVRGSRILKRQGSKFSIAANLTLEEEEDEMAKYKAKSRDGESKLDGRGIFHRHRSRHSDMHELLKSSISDPFNFQHVTHTNPSQLPPLEHTHPHDLATEFSILRAAQRPQTELKGIRAESIHYREPASEDTASVLAPDSQSLFTRSPPTSPKFPTSPDRFHTGLSPRATRSVENFSRPGSRARKPSYPSISPPPRGSSKFSNASEIPQPTTQTVDALLGLHSPTEFPGHTHSRTEYEPPRSPGPLAAPFSYDVGHAVTTDDGTARSLRSPHSRTPDLADVPEEDEISPWRMSPVHKSPPPKFATTVGFGGSSGRPQCNTPQKNVGAFLDVPRVSEELQSPTLPPKQAGLRNPPSTSRKEQEPKTQHLTESSGLAEESWEEYIDYCYEHAAESTTNFDWQRSSVDEPRTTEEQFSRLTIDERLHVEQNQPRGQQDASRLRAPSVGASGNSTPDLQSAVSTSTQPSSISTAPTESPLEFASTPSPKKTRNSQVQVVAQPSDGHISPDPYEALMTDGVQEETQYAYYAHSEDNCRSSRGSGSRISKCNSQESIILSRAASVARKHRSSVSTNSVPELVHSSSCSRETIDHDSGGSSEPPTALSPRASQSAPQWRSKILTKEFPPPRSDPSLPSTPTHDRANSVSVLEGQDSLSSMQPISPVQTRARASTILRGGTRRTRTSYSLFPRATSPPGQQPQV